MNRNNNFTLIHIVAAVMVIYGHQFVLLGLEAPQLFTMPIHNLGVRILFLVSGYLVTTSWYRSDDSITFLKKRIKRLYPPLIVCLLLTVLVLYFISHNKAVYFSRLIKNDICYGMYLYAFPVQQIIINLMYPRVGMEMMYLYFLISNFIVIILATLNYYAVEKY